MDTRLQIPFDQPIQGWYQEKVPELILPMRILMVLVSFCSIYAIRIFNLFHQRRNIVYVALNLVLRTW